MKIIFLYRYGILGGVCTQLYHRLRHLSDDMQMEIHCGFRSDHGVSEMLSPLATLHFGLNENNTAQFIDNQEFDVVIIIDSEEYLKACRNLSSNPKILVEVHTSIERNLEYLCRIEKSDIDHFITVSKYMIERIDFHRSEQAKDIPIHLFENVLDTELFTPNAEESVGPGVVLWVGKIDDHKDWRAYMQISHQISLSNQEVEFWIVGGQTCPEELAQEVFDYAEELGIIERFRWFDRIENDFMSSLYSLVSCRGGVNLVTSHGESFGMAVLESLLSSCPVISSDVGALSEITAESDYFKLYDLGDLQTAAKSCLELLNDAENHTRTVQELLSVQESLRNQYSSSKRSSTYWKLIKSLGDE